MTDLPSSAAHEKVKLVEINPYLTCPLCKGYFIDATTISECLHSFCRSCIIKFLQENSHCPVCEVIINEAKPNIKLDKTLQDIVYKLVPELFINEMTRRQRFYRNHPELAAKASAEERGVDTERTIFNPKDSISLSIEYISDDSTPGAIVMPPITDSSKLSKTDGESQSIKRFLQCPGMCRIEVLKKFVQNKYNVNTNMFHIDILYKRVPLPNHYTLIDIAYIYSWKRNEPMKFFFRITDKAVLPERFDYLGAVPQPEIFVTPSKTPRANGERPTRSKQKNKNHHPNKSIDGPKVDVDVTDKIKDEIKSELQNNINNNNKNPVYTNITLNRNSNVEIITKVQKVSNKNGQPIGLNIIKQTVKKARPSTPPSKKDDGNDDNSKVLNENVNVARSKIQKVSKNKMRKSGNKHKTNLDSNAENQSPPLEGEPPPKIPQTSPSKPQHLKIRPNSPPQTQNSDSLRIEPPQSTLVIDEEKSKFLKSIELTARMVPQTLELQSDATTTADHHVQRKSDTNAQQKGPQSPKLDQKSPQHSKLEERSSPKLSQKSPPKLDQKILQSPPKLDQKNPQHPLKLDQKIPQHLSKLDQKNPHHLLKLDQKSTQHLLKLDQKSLQHPLKLSQKRKSTSPIKNERAAKASKSSPKSKQAKPMQNPTVQQMVNNVNNSANNLSILVEQSASSTTDLQSLFDSCKINIPSSLSITLKESNDDDEGKSSPTPIKPVQNYIEILKLPDVSADQKRIEQKLENLSNHGLTIQEMGDPKSSNSKVVAPPRSTQTFQKMFEEAIKKPEFSNKFQPYIPTNKPNQKIDSQAESGPTGSKRNILEIASQLYKKTKLQSENDNNSSKSPLMGKVRIPRLNTQRTLKPLKINSGSDLAKNKNGCVMDTPSSAVHFQKTFANMHSASLGMNYTVSVNQNSSNGQKQNSPNDKFYSAQNIKIPAVKTVKNLETEGKTSPADSPVTLKSETSENELQKSFAVPLTLPNPLLAYQPFSPKHSPSSPRLNGSPLNCSISPRSPNIPSPRLVASPKPSAKSAQSSPKPNQASPKPAQLDQPSPKPSQPSPIFGQSSPKPSQSSPRPSQIGQPSPKSSLPSPKLGQIGQPSPKLSQAPGQNHAPRPNMPPVPNISSSRLVGNKSSKEKSIQQKSAPQLTPNQLLEKYNLQNRAQLSASLNFNAAAFGLSSPSQLAALQQAMILKHFELQNRQNWLNMNVQYEKYLQSLNGSHLLTKEN